MKTYKDKYDIIVTGAKGFIGHHLVKELKRDKENNVIEIDLKDGNDCSDREYLDSLPLAKEVYHLAANVVIPSDCPTINGAWAVANYCNKHGVRLIYTSSAAVYSAEETLENGSCMYGYSKLITEKIFSSKVEDLLICRLFNVYGEGGKGVIDEFINNDHIWIDGNGTQQRDYIHVSDVVRALMVPHIKGVYDIGTGRTYSVNDIAECFDIKPKNRPDYYGVEYSCAKLSHRFPWQAKKTVVTYIYEKTRLVKTNK